MVTLLTYVCLTGATLGVLACLAIRYRRILAVASDTICALSPTNKAALFIILLIAVARGGGKTNTEDNVDGGLTNLLTGAFRSLAHFIDPADDIHYPPITDEDIAFGWQQLGPFTNDTPSYAMPAGATLATNWWLRGAYEDVKRIGLGGLEGLEGLGGLGRFDSIWAFTWGKVRFALADTNEIVAVGAPMSAIPLCSRLWSATDTNGTFRITWEDFALGRIEESRLCPSGETPLPLCCAQIEFRANGDYVTRSNEIETVWRHIDPNDFDGDGYLNGDDPNPFEWDDGADTYYGPYNDLPRGCNEDAYCDVTIEIDSTQGEWVTFTGDDVSDYSDPCFYAKPGVPYDVKILIGKTYHVTCDAPIRAVAKSDPDIEVRDVATNAFTVVWPVTITEAPRLFAAPLPGLLGGSHGNTGFFLDVDPYWLDGVFIWTTNTCCQIVDNNGWWEFACEDDCQCGGCEIGGSYTYEGYTVFFGSINCGCHYTPHDNTSFGLTAPSAVFKDGALRPLEITFHHGDTDVPEEGELTLQVIRQNGNSGQIRLWEDPDKTWEATSPQWDVSSFDGCTLYIEGLEKSRQADDIRFRLTWTRPGGSSAYADATTTCAEVKETQVTSFTPGITDGSSNQQPFAGHTNWDFDVTRSLNPDKHFAVLFRDVVNPDFSVRDFSVRMTLVVDPPDASVGTASWFPLDPTPQSGSIVSTGARIGELQDPKVGGVYHIGSCFDGSPTNECNIVLPLAGASVDAQIFVDFENCKDFVTNVLKFVGERKLYLIDPRFGRHLFWDYGNGDYRGRPANTEAKMAWHYNQVRDSDSLGATCTCMGLPIRMSKLSNFMAGYVTERMGVPSWARKYSQRWGSKNDRTADLSWSCGESVAKGMEFADALSNCVYSCWHQHEPKADKQWPCLLPAENYIPPSLFIYPNYSYTSPGFLDMEDAEDFDY